MHLKIFRNLNLNVIRLSKVFIGSQVLRAFSLKCFYLLKFNFLKAPIELNFFVEFFQN
jgi:hypothetical protein